MTRTSQFPWLDRIEYPFESRYFETLHGDMHYVDEGTGDHILFIHGNPTWSFMYRHLIKALSKGFRCIAPDHIGFGLSDKPHDVSYLPQFHAENLEQFVEKLGLDNLTLVIHDWGGAIGMSYALNHPANVKRLIIINTWSWPIQGNKVAEYFSRFMGSPIGWFSCRYMNAFPRFVVPAVFGDKKKLTKSAYRHYIMPFPTPDSRKGTWVFPKAIVGETEWLDSLWAKRTRLKNRPVLILWGLKDPAFRTRELERWKGAFPNHETLNFPTVGHFVAEEIGRDLVSPISSFLNANP